MKRLNPQTHFKFYQKDAKRIAAAEAKQKACDDWLASLEIRRNSLETMNNAANASTEYDWKILKGYYDVPLDELLPDEDEDFHHHTDKAGKRRIQELADEIVANGWIEAVIVEYENPPDGEPTYTLIEGQHRARAMRLLGCSKVIAQVYEVLWDK